MGCRSSGAPGRMRSRPPRIAPISPAVKGRILIVEPDPQRREALELECAALGYEIVCARDVNDALTGREAEAHERERAAARRPIVAASSAMIALLEELERLAWEPTPVLLSGEAGVGKESLARALHTQSTRRDGPFVVADCRAPAGNDPTAMLLGDADGIAGESKRSARGQVAHAEGGTLFLDGVEALPLPLQENLAGLLREGRIQTRSDAKPRRIDVRIVATSCVDADTASRGGALHPELQDRLATLVVPALRDRREDLPLLIDHALARACAHLGRETPAIGSDALGRLVAHPWPGNLRELEATVLTGAVRAVGGVLTLRELPDAVAHEASAGTCQDLALKPARKAFEMDWIRRALRVAGGNRTHAARLLEISHRALLYKLKEFGITS